MSSQAVATFSPARLPYHPIMEKEFGIDKAGWRALTESVFPNAKTADSILLALAYCKARNLDPFKRVVHIVPMWNSALRQEVETVWPGIAEMRTTAFRTKSFAGSDPATWGDEREVTYEGQNRKGERRAITLRRPDWCQITVHRMIEGQRCAFPGPRVYFDETYSQWAGAPVPNDRWSRAPRQMLEKCAEAAALRRAFPEELGNEMAADEMDGKPIIDGTAMPVLHADAPPAPKRADFAEKAQAQKVAVMDEEDEEAVGPEIVIDPLADAEAQGEEDARANLSRDPARHNLPPGAEAMAYLSGWDRVTEAAFPADPPTAGGKR